MAKAKRAEKIKEELRKLTLLDDNKFCFDCGLRGPLYVVLDYHIFVCSQCSAIHRSAQHKVKGISMSEFSEDELKQMKFGGNGVAKKVYLNNFRGTLPKDGDEKAIKDHIRHIFEEKRYYDANAHNEAKQALEAGSLPPVQPLPNHIALHLSVDPKPAAQAQQPPVAHQPQRSEQRSEQVQQQQQQQPAPQPQQPTPPQKPIDVFDSIFDSQPASRPVQQQPMQNPEWNQVQQQQQYHQQQQQQPQYQHQMQQQQRSSGLDVDTLFNGPPQNNNPQPQQPGGQNNAHYAAQVQMHTTQYQHVGGQHAAQAQMGQHYNQHQQPQQFYQSPQAAQMQMSPPQQAYSSSTPYAAQHQMNSAGQYNRSPQQSQQYGNQQYGASNGNSAGGMNFFAPPPQQQQQYQQPQQQYGQQQGYGSNGGGMDFFSSPMPGGPPPIPQYQSQQTSNYPPNNSSSPGQRSSQPAAESKPAGPDPFASLDFFHKK